MANIAATDVTYTEANGGQVPTKFLAGKPPVFRNRVTVTFGGAGLTYPANGVPLTATKLGFPNNTMYSVNIEDTSGNTITHLWTYDVAHNTLRGYTAEATEIATNAAISTAQTFVLDVAGS